MTGPKYWVVEAVRSEIEGMRFVVVELGDDVAREIARFYRPEEAEAYACWRTQETGES